MLTRESFLAALRTAAKNQPPLTTAEKAQRRDALRKLADSLSPPEHYGPRHLEGRSLAHLVSASAQPQKPLGATTLALKPLGQRRDDLDDLLNELISTLNPRSEDELYELVVARAKLENPPWPLDRFEEGEVLFRRKNGKRAGLTLKGLKARIKRRRR